MRVRSQRGLTIVELLITIVICGIIAAIAIPSLWATRKAMITTRFEKHFGFSIEPFISNHKTNTENWLTADQKKLLRPIVAAKIEAVCKDPMEPLTKALKERAEFVEQAADLTTTGVTDRLKRLHELDMNVDATRHFANEATAACDGTRQIATRLDLLPK